MRNPKINLLTLLVCAILSLSRAATSAPDFNGRWTLLAEKSSPIEIYDKLSLDITTQGDDVTILQTWGDGDLALPIKYTLKTGGAENTVPVTNRVCPTDVFMGVSMDVRKPQLVKAQWSADRHELTLDRRFTMLGSQGEIEVPSRDTYTLSQYGDRLTLTVARPFREGAPYTFILKHAGTKEGWLMKLGNHWDVAGSLDENALLISLQGLANTDAPRLYFLYPEDWEFRFTPGMYDYYRQHLDYTFTELKTIEQALKTFREHVKGYIVWDRATRTSLNVAFTIAGLERGVVISPEQIPLLEKLGFKPLADLRGKYTGKSDLEIYRSAYAEYGARCSRDYIVWMGGVTGARMLPGIADFGIAKRAFFTDLSTKRTDVDEYALARDILSKQKPLSMLMGWHSYAKDRERDYVTLASNFGIRIEGLNTFPNLSFTSMTPPSPGFQFRNHHNVVPGKTYTPGKKVYVSCLQTDGLGLGAEHGTGRGTMPYAFEVTINWLWMAPTMLEYYYSTATPNDLFIGAITGPGYMYPKAIPPKLLPELIGLADDMIRKLDINIFETMDYSEGSTVVGNTEIPKAIVDAYYQRMPEVIGFANGYAPSFTFASRDGRPFISFDYYLSEKRPEAEAVRDLKELARINPARPYFLLVHVREWSDITRVKAIMDQLGSDFEVVPLDIFMKLAGQNPTFKERYQPETAPKS